MAAGVAESMIYVGRPVFVTAGIEVGNFVALSTCQQDMVVNNRPGDENTVTDRKVILTGDKSIVDRHFRNTSPS